MPEPIIIANWCYAIEGLQASSQEFYQQVAEAIRKRNIPDCEMNKVTLSEGGVLSSNREYLRVRRQSQKARIIV